MSLKDFQNMSQEVTESLHLQSCGIDTMQHGVNLEAALFVFQEVYSKLDLLREVLEDHISDMEAIDDE